MEKTLYFNELFNIYGELLTDNEQELFSLYYEENITMQEISEIKGISKSAVGNCIKTAENKLLNYEDKIKFLMKKEEILKLLNSKNYDKIIDILNS